ncbi:MAG: hypothetical protein EZS28_016856 [Streblomastix strix]|uniref:Uncharacterized protein n=1 Tax=Streblomastix strix TaxID=222440 RepID=A0A5J4VYG6_9EUKA|nr:MAG: hypothetical protein EZS28_016856 [Streblomastix strix]
MGKLDATSERASEKVRKEFRAGARQAIVDDRIRFNNAFLSLHRVAKELAGDANQQREVAVAPNNVKKVLNYDGGISNLFGKESMLILTEVVKIQRLIDSQKSVESKTGPAQQISIKQDVSTQNGEMQRKTWAIYWI